MIKKITIIFLAVMLAVSTMVSITAFVSASEAKYDYTEWNDAAKPTDFSYLDVSNTNTFNLGSLGSINDKTLSVNQPLGTFGGVQTKTKFGNYRTSFDFLNDPSKPVGGNGYVRWIIMTDNIPQNTPNNGYMILLYGKSRGDGNNVIQVHRYENGKGNFIVYKDIGELDILDGQSHKVDLEFYTVGDVATINLAIDGTSYVHKTDENAPAKEGVIGLYNQVGITHYTSNVESEYVEPVDFDYQLWKADPERPADEEFENIDLLDSNAMNFEKGASINGNMINVGNVTSWNNNLSVKKYDAYRAKFYLSLPTGYNLETGNFRVVLKAQSIGASNTDYEEGYFLNIMDSRMDVMKGGTADDGKYKAYFFEKYTDVQIVDGEMHLLEIEVYEREDGDVVMNFAVDRNPYQCVDDGTKTEQFWGLGSIPERDQPANSGVGQFGFSYTTPATVNIVNDIVTENFTDEIVFGDNLLWGNGSGAVAVLEPGEFNLPADSNIYNINALSSFSTKFDLTVTNNAKADALYLKGALGYQTVNPGATDINTASNKGYFFEIYNDYFILKVSGKEVARAKLENLGQGVHNVCINFDTLDDSRIVSVAVDDKTLVYQDRSEYSAIFDGYFMLGTDENAVKLTGIAYVEEPFKVLFCGNSITNHGVSEKNGWYFNWGMAADSPDKDYVHLVMENIRNLEVNGEKPYKDATYMTMGMGDWERAYATKPLSDYALYREFDADLIIMRIGENVASAGASYQQSNPFDLHYKRLIDYLNLSGEAKIVLTTSYWGEDSAVKEHFHDKAIVEVALERNYPLVRLGDLGSIYKDVNHAYGDQAYYYNSDKTYQINGETWTGKQVFDAFDEFVKAHPGNTGMKNIADRINASVTDLLTGGDGFIDVQTKISDKIIAETKGELPGTFKFAETDKNSAEFDKFNNKQGDNLVLLNLYEVNTMAELYRVTMKLDLDDAQFGDFKFYYFNGKESVLLNDDEVNVFTSNTYDPEVFLSKQMDGYLGMYIVCDFEKMFVDENGVQGAIDSANYVNVLKEYYRKEDTLYFDMTKTSFEGVNSFIIGRAAYPGIISSQKDVKIILSNEVVISLTSDLFEALAKTEKALFFRVEKMTNANQIEKFNAIDTAFGLNSEYAYNIDIRYGDATGDAVAIRQGIEIQIPVAFSISSDRIGLLSAVIPKIKTQEISKLETSPCDFEVNDSFVVLKPYNFDRTYAFVEDKVVGIEITAMPDKVKYEVNEKFDSKGIVVQAIYASGKQEMVDIADLSFENVNFNKEGTFDVKVKYSEGNEVFENTIKVSVEKAQEKPDGGNQKGGCSSTISNYSVFAAILLVGALMVIVIKKNKGANK